nr:putative membrane protein [Quercus suber]
MPPKSDEVRPQDRPSVYHRQSSTLHYQTFPTAPPRRAGPKPAPRDMREDESSAVERTASGRRRSGSSSKDRSANDETPLPKGQLAILAVIALAEQTALNSISPYLPDMASTFDGVDESQVGLYVGLIASAFALAQFITNFAWGWLSDRVGRKPIVLTGTLFTAVCFIAFGFCRQMWQAVLVQALMGLVNGNQGVISTCLGEITDRSNQSRAFTYLPVIYGIGGITGPIVGGLLVFKQNPFDTTKPNPYPYLAPNLFSAAILVIDFVLTAIFLEESLECAQDLPPLGKRFGSLFSWLWQFSSSHSPTYLKRSAANKSDHSHRYNSLYPIFAQAAPPTGRNLSPVEIGISLAFAGVVTILFQVGIFGRLREKIGNKITYRVGQAGFVVAFLLMPWVGYKSGRGTGAGAPTASGKVWLWVELGVVLIIKTVASVGGLTSALLLITNSAPSHAVLGTLNGLAQTLSAAGRAVGPFISGALFSAATKVQPKGEALAFGVFGGISFIGFLLSFGIRGAGLEAEGFDDEESGDEEEGDETEADDDDTSPEGQRQI